MFRALFAWLLLSSTAMASIVDSQIWMNEFHYDNEGADENEFVEVVAPTWLTDLSTVTLTLYNGSNGLSYRGPTELGGFTPGDSVDGFTFYRLDISLQNGAPDGLALAQNDDVLQFLSYEGAFTAANGAAEGLLSSDIGLQQSPSNPRGSSLQLVGTGDSYSEFTWQLSSPQSPGFPNSGQTVVPEPTSLLLWMVALGLPLLLRAIWRRWRI